MAFRDSKGDKQELQQALIRLVPDLTSLKKFQYRYSQWAEAAGMEFASRPTLDNWMKHDFRVDPDPKWDAQKTAALYAFVKTHPEYSVEGDSASSLLYLLEKHFPAPHTLPRHYLDSFTGGPFAMFRRLWSKQQSPFYIRSIVTFSHEDGAFLYEEKQDYFDPVKKMQRRECDKGYVLRFGYNICIVTLEETIHCLKFLVMHDSDPPPNGQTKVSICKGNLIAVAGRGPHPGFKFIMRRIEGGEDVESRIVHENDLDDDTKAYLTG